MSRLGPRIRPILSAGGRWPTPERLVKFVDVGLKSTALVAAVLAAGLIAAPRVEATKARIQAFIDVRALEDRYIGLFQSAPPYVVVTAAREYNRLNERDILTEENASQDVVSIADLCSSRRPRRMILTIFPATDCSSADPVLGSPSRGRTYERLLIAAASSSLTVAEIRSAMLLLRDSEYIVARYLVTNLGSGYATNVRLSTPEQFLASDDQPFSLPPHAEYSVRFQTRPGQVERDPSQEQLLAVSVTWEPGGGIITRNAQRLVLLLLAILLLWTIVAEALAARRQPSSSADQETGAASS
jgi:hypothetical protein